MANKAYVITPHRIDDPELERVMYGPGDNVPLDDAIRYGLVEPELADAANELLASTADTSLGVELSIEVPGIDPDIEPADDNEEPDVATDSNDEPPADEAPPQRGKRRGGNRAHAPAENRSAED